ncbi:MAG TPA: hypothetical protein VNE82_09220 [Candidatus Binataceae bacterium]|nr:hypothetical protein [Candidatus Binataceae bacterium]HVB80104.1 hypothetical protein [Candidatus Binataceae bacterium]
MAASASQLHLVLGSASVAGYPQGGGHWSWFLQYPAGLKALGHRVTWLEVLKAEADPARTQARVREFLERVQTLGLADDCIVAVIGGAGAGPEFYGAERRLPEVARDADLFWNLACGVRDPILSLFKRRVLIDVDPGHLQVGALACELEIDRHDAFLSVGARLGRPGCEVPTLGHRWSPFRPFVYLPDWHAAPDPGPDAPFTSATQWTWEVLNFGDRYVSTSKRTAYLRYLELPLRARRRFRLAANIGASDPAGDRALLESYGWELADPHQVATTPAAYQDFIRASRAEFLCPKPIYRELKTGWISDRSVSYLASGRPVLAEETGFSESIPAGRGLIAFRDLEEAAAGVAAIDADYARHSRAARELCEAYFDSRRCLSEMIEASFA